MALYKSIYLLTYLLTYLLYYYTDLWLPEVCRVKSKSVQKYTIAVRYV